MQVELCGAVILQHIYSSVRSGTAAQVTFTLTSRRSSLITFIQTVYECVCSPKSRKKEKHQKNEREKKDLRLGCETFLKYLVARWQPKAEIIFCILLF